MFRHESVTLDEEGTSNVSGVGPPFLLVVGRVSPSVSKCQVF